MIYILGFHNKSMAMLFGANQQECAVLPPQRVKLLTFFEKADEQVKGALNI